jgi:hypothetical protein
MDSAFARALTKDVQVANAIALLALLLLLAASGCETQAFRTGQTATVHFGIVRNAEEVRLQSNVPAGALVGGTIGLAASGGSGVPVRNAIIGAALGGAATAVAEGNRTGVQYTVELAGGTTIRIISDQREIRPGDCVAVEQVGQTANIRRESAAYCAGGNAQAVQSLQEDIQRAAARCEAAKEELVHASTSEAADLARRKIDLLCNS